MKVWLAVWKSKPPQVFAHLDRLLVDVNKDFDSGLFDNEDIGYVGFEPGDTGPRAVLIDDWLNAKEVEVVD